MLLPNQLIKMLSVVNGEFFRKLGQNLNLFWYFNYFPLKNNLIIKMMHCIIKTRGGGIYLFWNVEFTYTIWCNFMNCKSHYVYSLGEKLNDKTAFFLKKKYKKAIKNIHFVEMNAFQKFHFAYSLFQRNWIEYQVLSNDINKENNKIMHFLS